MPVAAEPPENRQQPLHTNVHLGEPGSGGDIFVAYGSDGVLTPEAQELCGGVFVNG